MLLSRGDLTTKTKTKEDKHRYHHFNGMLSQVTNVPWFFSVKLLMVSKIAAAESSTATGALGPPMSVLAQPGYIAANKIPVFIRSKSLAKAKKMWS